MNKFSFFFKFLLKYFLFFVFVYIFFLFNSLRRNWLFFFFCKSQKIVKRVSIFIIFSNGMGLRGSFRSIRQNYRRFNRRSCSWVVLQYVGFYPKRNRKKMNRNRFIFFCTTASWSCLDMRKELQIPPKSSPRSMVGDHKTSERKKSDKTQKIWKMREE